MGKLEKPAWTVVIGWNKSRLGLDQDDVISESHGHEVVKFLSKVIFRLTNNSRHVSHGRGERGDNYFMLR